MNRMVDFALAYLAKGWSVFPANGKKPAIQWGKYAERLPTADEVKHWWAQNPHFNIALATGRVSGLVVVDVDVKPRKDAPKGANPSKVFEQHPTGLVSRTGSGGGHLFYQYPSDIEHVANRVGSDGLDIRGDGGYVILPPSLHPESQKRYHWLSEKAPAPCPDFVWSEQSLPPTGVAAKDNDWLSKALVGGMVEGEGRNNTATRLAGYYLGKGLNRDVVRILLQQWNERNREPLSERELETTLTSVFKTQVRKEAAEAKNGKPVENKTFKLTPFKDYMQKFGGIAVQWAIEEWMPKDTVAMCISPPGTYKTWTVLDLVVSYASGKPFLGQFPMLQEPCPVIVVQQEDFHGQIAERLAMSVAAKYGIFPSGGLEDEGFEVFNPPDLPIHVHEEREFRFDDPAIVLALEKKIEQIRPGLLVIDPLYSAAGTEDFMASSAQQMLVLKRWRDRYGVSSLVVHHTKKATEGVSTREQAWGSQFLNAFLETGWQLRRIPDEENTVSMLRHFKVKGAMKPLSLDWNVSTDAPFKYEIKVEELDEEKLSERSDIVGWIEKNGESSISKIAEGLGKNRSTISRKLTTLIKAGALFKNSAGLISIPKGPAI